jgi:flagellar biosynthesis chaperone FliJ
MKLDVLRRYRAQLEDVMRMDLFLLRRSLQDAEAEAQLHETSMKSTTDAYLANVGRGVALDDFLVWQSRLAAETARLVEVKQIEGQIREAWNQKQHELREAIQDRRTLDRLADRMRQQRLLAENRIEQMETDEAASRTRAM